MSDSPAITIAPPATDQLTGITPAENKEWRNTGKLPERPAATPETTEKPAPTANEPVPERKSKTAERFEVLTQHNRELKAQLDALLKKMESPAPAGEAKPAPPAETKQVDSKIPEGFTKPKPKLSDYDGSEGKAYEDYTEALTDWKVDLKLAQNEAARQQQDKEKEQRAKIQTAEERFAEQVKEAEKTFPDIREKIFSKDVPFNDIVAGFIKDSEKGAELAYKLASDLTELARIQALNPYGQARELSKLEVSLSAQAPPVAPAKKLTEAPPPPREVGSGATPPKDELESLVSKTDANSVRAYLRTANQRDIARKRG